MSISHIGGLIFFLIKISARIVHSLLLCTMLLY